VPESRVLEYLDGAAGDRMQIVFPSGERRVGEVFEANLELIAGETLVEVLYL
jgi:hypothetical protein